MPRILLVEDHEPVMTVLTKQLLACGVDVDGASTGVEGIRKATSYDRLSYCMIFMDLGLPDLSGLAAAIAIRSFEKVNGLIPIPIIALTGYSDKLEDTIAAGMEGCLVKPVSIEKLKKAIETFSAIRPVRK